MPAFSIMTFVTLEVMNGYFAWQTASQTHMLWGWLNVDATGKVAISLIFGLLATAGLSIYLAKRRDIRTAVRREAKLALLGAVLGALITMFNISGFWAYMRESADAEQFRQTSAYEQAEATLTSIRLRAEQDRPVGMLLPLQERAEATLERGEMPTRTTLERSPEDYFMALLVVFMAMAMGSIYTMPAPYVAPNRYGRATPATGSASS
jgi:hypothetical protein